MKQIFEGGLRLRFVGEIPQTTRRRKSLAHSIYSIGKEMEDIIVRLENRGERCSPFTLNSTIQPMLYLVNQIDFPKTYLDEEIKTWDGRTLELPVRRGLSS